MSIGAKFTKDRGDFATGALMWDVLNLVAAHRRSLPGTIDLTSIGFLRPYSIAALCALGQRTGRRCGLALPSDARCRDHLVRCGMPTWFTPTEPAATIDARETNVVVEHLVDKPGNASERVVDILTKNATLAPGEGPQIKDHLDEVIRNALVHSGSDVGCFVAGQMFPKRKTLELAIVDLGCSIPVHLRRNPKYAHIKTQREAVLRATENGVTGTVGLNRWNEPNSGAGLYQLRQFCSSGRGELAILTGGIGAVFGQKDKPILWPYRGGFAGSLVNIRFFLQHGLPTTESSTTIW